MFDSVLGQKWGNDESGVAGDAEEKEMSEKVTTSQQNRGAADEGSGSRGGKRVGGRRPLPTARVLGAIALMAILVAGAAPAMAYSVLHTHSPGPQFSYSWLILDGSGTLYGTTYQGGTTDVGTVFRVKPDGTGFQVLHSFTGGASDGMYPFSSLVVDGSGNLYGTTVNGGPSDGGTVFRVKTDGTGFQLLHSFAGGVSDGSSPFASLILDGSGNLYGTTYQGGLSNLGIVFSLKTDGTGFQLLHPFAGGVSDGSNPQASLIVDGSGNLYGTTYFGGNSNLGTVFSVKIDGTGFQLLHSFAGGASDGDTPQASLTLDGSGNLYGTTLYGGTSDAGTVFKVTTVGTLFQLLHPFAGGASDGSHPWASLILDGSGNLLGTTGNGGPSDAGTVFRVKTDGTSYQLLHSFTGGASDGMYPYASLILDGSGNLYGTTYQGGAYNVGTVFTVKTNGAGFQLSFTFKGGASDGSNPQTSLILGGSGDLYGTTYLGGAFNAGTVFVVKTDGTGFQLLYTFAGGASDGLYPSASLILDGSGNLYGTAYQGGTSNFGTLFSVKTDGTGFQLLHSFAGGASDGAYPLASLVSDGVGNLYGTTYQGGTSDLGTAFKMKTDGTGFQLLHSFTGSTSDGSNPLASLVLDGSGNLYGMTPYGGSLGAGTVFSVKTDGTSFQPLHSFTGGASDGSNPQGSLILDGAGNLYGTTMNGGMTDIGTVFSLKTDGTAFQLLHVFTGGVSDGSDPQASLVLDAAGNLYGTSLYGGPSDLGTVFSVKTNGTLFQLLHSFAGVPGDGSYPYAPLIRDSYGNLYGTTYQGGSADMGTEFTIASLCMAPSQPGSFTASTPNVCPGQSNVAYAVPNDVAATYSWSYSGTGATIVGSGNSVTLSFSASATSGTLSVTAANVCGTSSAQSLALTVNPLPAKPTIIPSGATTFCTGSNVTLNSSAGGSYLWSTGATTSSISVSTSGSYWVQVTGAGGCTSPQSDPTVVTVNPLPAITSVLPTTASTGFVGGSVSWSVTNAATYDVTFDTVNPPQNLLVKGTAATTAATPVWFSSTPYYWRIVAHGPCGDTTSPVYSFRTGTCAFSGAAPTLAVPADAAGNQPIATILSWNALPGTAHYDLFLGTASPPTVRYREVYDPATSLQVQLAPGTTYYWQVKAVPVCGNGVPTASAVRSFTTASSTLTLSSVSPTFLNRWTGGSLSLMGSGFLAITTPFTDLSGHSAGTYTEGPWTPTQIDGTVAADLTIPAGRYDVGVMETGTELGRLSDALVVRAFTDVTETAFFFESSSRVSDAGIMEADFDSVTSGPQFVPAAVVTRALMAEYLAKSYQWMRTRSTALPTATCTPSGVGSTDFPDVPCTHADWLAIHWIKTWGITAGASCPVGGGLCYLPDGSITRGQMATFLTRLKYGAEGTGTVLQGFLNGFGANDPGCGSAYPSCIGWTDPQLQVPATTWPHAYVNVTYQDRLTNGCGGTLGALTFCTGGLVTRGQMAEFLGRTVGLVPTP